MCRIRVERPAGRPPSAAGHDLGPEFAGLGLWDKRTNAADGTGIAALALANLSSFRAIIS
jgi:hypothetical protein